MVPITSFKTHRVEYPMVYTTHRVGHPIGSDESSYMAIKDDIKFVELSKHNISLIVRQKMHMREVRVANYPFLLDYKFAHNGSVAEFAKRIFA